MSNRLECSGYRYDGQLPSMLEFLEQTMRKKPIPEFDTKTTEFELEDIEEAYQTAPVWKGTELPKLQVETPPELRVAIEHLAKAWILERREGSWFAVFKRWLFGKTLR